MIHDFPKHTSSKWLFLFWNRASLWLLLAMGLVILGFGGSRFFHYKYQTPPMILVLKTNGKNAIGAEIAAQYFCLKRGDLPNFPVMEQKAKESGAFEKIQFHLLSGGKIAIDYLLREPLFLLGNLGNTYVDYQGHVFQALPFYSPKNLPCLFVQQRKLTWGDKLNEQEIEFVRGVEELGLLSQFIQIDLSKMFISNLGEREIVLKLKEGGYIRLPKDQSLMHLEKFLNQREKNLEPLVYDLRVKNAVYTRRAYE